MEHFPDGESLPTGGKKQQAIVKELNGRLRKSESEEKSLTELDQHCREFPVGTCCLFILRVVVVANFGGCECMKGGMARRRRSVTSRIFNHYCPNYN